MAKYNHQKTEAKWQKFWQTKKTFVAKDFSKKPKKYVLIEFPYPSGEGLHMGHLRPYVAGDVYSRYLRLKGHEVIYPIGWDAFGLPAENYAIKMGLPPAATTKKNIANAKKQLGSWGMSFDWSREINTTDPNYYKWTQWIFLQLYKAGLAYEATGLINWCPKDKTGLANEEVIDGACERCGTKVEKKELRQWYLKITAYAEKLLEGLKTLNWPEQIKIQQENWIGKSVGAEISFPIEFPYAEKQANSEKPNYLILHGYTGLPGKNFIPWLKKELESRGFKVQSPELPNSNDPKESDQVEYVIKNCVIDKNTIILGHSLGGLVAMEALLKHNQPIAGLVLAAPAIDPNFPGAIERPFWKNFSWNIDYEKLKKLSGFRLIISDLAEEKRVSYLEALSKKIDAGLTVGQAQKNHFTAENEPIILESLLPTIKVFTTRPDTIFGATYMVLSPEHPWVLLATDNRHNVLENKDKVKAYVEESKKKTDIQRSALEKEKTGVELKGVEAINPATKEKIPVWVADYVLMGYGTGAIMAVPAHDERDLEFAKKFGLPIRNVINKSDKNCIIVHGSPHKDHTQEPGYKEERDRHWILWIKEQLSDLGTAVFNPQMPTPWYPDYQEWKKEFEKLPVNENTILIGHSAGGAFVTRWLSEKKIKIDKLILVAPSKISNSGQEDKIRYESLRKFYDFQISPEIKKLANERIIFVSNDEQRILDSVKIYQKELGAKIVELRDRGHFISREMGTREFPELLEAIMSQSHMSTGYGVLINSGRFTGQKSEQAIPKITAEFGRPKVQYKLRDWVFSRQRYWGEPIPIIHCPKCGIVPVPEKDLPVKLPPVKKYEPTGTGESPLAAIASWVNVKCPNCGSPAKRETNTMPQWAGSSWYWLRYTDPENKNSFADMKKQEYWTPVDVYFGGMEHTTLHLLYSRFWNLFLYDQKLVTSKEPYVLRQPHGIILGPDGEKMSKSRGNVVNPNEIVKKFGADTLRMYELFLGPHEMTVSWNDQGIVGVKRFLDRVFLWVNQIQSSKSKSQGESDKAKGALHKLIKKVTEDLDSFRFNTAVSAFMEFHNEIKGESVTIPSVKKFLVLLYSFAPHLCEELNQIIGGKESLQKEPWPKFDPALVKDETVEIVIQVNGKVKSRLMLPRDTNQQTVQQEAMKLEPIKQATAGGVKRAVFVPNKLINFVI